VPGDAAGVRIGAAVAPGETLKLPPDLDRPLVEIDVLPSQSERLALAQSKRETDRPADTVTAALRSAEDAPGLVLTERLDLDLSGRGSVNKRGDVTSFPRRSATLSMRDRIRCVFRTLDGAFPAADIVA
jgi:hypothetical protein